MEPPRRGATKKNGQGGDKEILDITSVLLFLGADNVPNGSGWRKMRCIHGERNPSACVNVEEDAYKCFSCGLGGDTISLLRTQLNLTYPEACAKYEEITGQAVGNRLVRRNQGEAKAAESKSYESGGFLANRLRKGL